MEVDLESLIRSHADATAAVLRSVAAAADSEEDVRHAVNSRLDAFIDAADLSILGRHEYGLAGGRIDSRYGRVIIEYKASKGPTRITEDLDAPGTRKAVEQVKQRFLDLESHENIDPDKLLGLACDGDTLVFIRHRAGEWAIDPPRPVSPSSVERLLRALVSIGATGHSFTPGPLAAAFGADSQLAQRGVSGLYRAITATDDAKALTFFDQWRVLFGEVCGYDVTGRNPKVDRLGDHYGLVKALPDALLFSVHTYYAIFMKLLAAEIATFFTPFGTSAIKQCIGASTSLALRDQMARLEEGGIWNQLGISNFLEGDLFAWYLAAWDERLEQVIRGMLAKLDEFDPKTLSVEPAESRDLLKKLYQDLFPRSVRHDLGEYYTPDWLAELTLDELGYDGSPDRRLLDPACGSGTFLVLAINRVLAWFDEHRHSCGFGEDELLQKLRTNIVGFDLNPLAVMAARTNYLMAIRQLLPYAGGVELPVYLCDSILTPAEYGGGGLLSGERSEERLLHTAVGEFQIPAEIASSREHLRVYADTIEHGVRNRYSADEFIQRCADQGLPTGASRLHRTLFAKLVELDAENRNGIWARIIKNAFAPLFVGRFEYVAGNPPWVNWEHLPPDYRDAMKPLWQEYGLFSLSGSAGRLGGGKKDLSMLMTYAAVDNYLADGGRLGFVITQTVFKTKGAGDGFRRLQFGEGGRAVHLRPVAVNDFSAMQVFEGATNNTAVLVVEKHATGFSYPVPYTAWRGPGRIPQETPPDEVRERTTRRRMGAIPVEPGKPTSPWLTAPAEALPGLMKLLGPSHYTAHAGVYTGGLNGCYWIRVLDRLPSGDLLIENLWNVGKIKVEHLQVAIEPDLVYPLLRGRDVRRWQAEPTAHIILAQDPATRAAVPEAWMKRHCPKTYDYLRRFEPQLRQRATKSVRNQMQRGPFYAMFAVGPYTLAPWKVMWPEVGTSARAAALGVPTGEPVPLPSHTVVAVDCPGAASAHYLSGALNSSPCQVTVLGYVTMHPSPHVMNHLAIPEFDGRDVVHQRLASLSEQAHAAAERGDEDALPAIEAQIDEAAAELWGITPDELAAIQAARRELAPGHAQPDDDEED